MSDFRIQKMRINDIYLDKKNPRVNPTSSQREAINALMKDQGDKLVNLMKHISENGVNPTARSLVFKENNKYIDGDGNRRLAAMKIAHTINLLDDEKWIKKIKNLNINITNFPNEIECVVFKNRNEARVWIKLNHNGQGDGAGTVTWSSAAKDRFNDVSSIGTQLIERYIDKNQQSGYKKTNIDRFFSKASIKEKFNINLKDGEIIFEDVKNSKIKNLIEDLKDVNAVDIYNKKAIIEFYERWENGQSNKSNESSGKISHVRPSTNDRKGVAPRDLILEIKCTRTNNIFDELKKIKVGYFPNASAILLRTFLELSVNYYIDKNNIPIPSGKVSLLFYLKTAYIEMNLSKDEEKALDAITSNKNHPAHTNILNSYAHNKNHAPDPNSIKIAFDSWAVFLKKIYEK